VANAVDIVNMALSHIGDGATVTSIDPPEGSANAGVCARFYPVARDEIIESRAWSFATRRVSLGAPLAAIPAGWTYAYAAPGEMVRALEVMDPVLGSQHKILIPFDVEAAQDGTKLVLTDVPGAVLRYIHHSVEPERFSPLFATALSWLLASYIAGPIIKGETGQKIAESSYKFYMQKMAEAASSDASGSQQLNERDAPWIRSR
jgi:hypothetical protein